MDCDVQHHGALRSLDVETAERAIHQLLELRRAFAVHAEYPRDQDGGLKARTPLGEASAGLDLACLTVAPRESDSLDGYIGDDDFASGDELLKSSPLYRGFVHLCLLVTGLDLPVDGTNLFILYTGRNVNLRYTKSYDCWD